MDTNKMRTTTDATNIEAKRWKSIECRKIMVNKIADYLIKHGPPSWTQNLPGLIQSVERFEEKVFASSKVEAEYIAKVSAKLKSVGAPLQSAESSLLLSNSSGSGEESETNMEWQEEVYQKVQIIKATYFTKLVTIHKLMSRKLQQLQNESVPQQPKTSELEKCEHHKQQLEYIFSLLNVNKNQINPSFKQKLDKVEKYIHSVVQTKIVSSHHQQQHSVDVHYKQQFVPSNSSISQLEISEKKPTLQVIIPSSSHLIKQIPQPNKMHLQDHQETNQCSSSQQQGNEVSIAKGCGNAAQPHTSGEIKPSEAFVISTTLISASSLPEDCRYVNEPTVISDDSSPAMQRLIKVLASLSAEALMAASDEIGAVLHLNDDISTLEPLNRLPDISFDANSRGVSCAVSQARYLNWYDFAPREKKIKRFFNSTPASDCFRQFTGAEKPISNSIISQENYTILEEIKVINNLLIDTEVVISEGSTILRAVEGAAEHGEGLIIKLLFNSVTLNLNPMSQHSTNNKKPIIKPLRFLVPISYPLCSPVILDERTSETSSDSTDVDDLSMKANLKLRLSLQCLNQPLSLQNIAMLWDHCVREAVCEYAQLHGGGTLSSKYGGWEICSNGC